MNLLEACCSAALTSLLNQLIDYKKQNNALNSSNFSCLDENNTSAKYSTKDKNNTVQIQQQQFAGSDTLPADEYTDGDKHNNENIFCLSDSEQPSSSTAAASCFVNVNGTKMSIANVGKEHLTKSQFVVYLNASWLREPGRCF